MFLCAKNCIYINVRKNPQVERPPILLSRPDKREQAGALGLQRIHLEGPLPLHGLEAVQDQGKVHPHGPRALDPLAEVQAGLSLLICKLTLFVYNDESEVAEKGENRGDQKFPEEHQGHLQEQPAGRSQERKEQAQEAESSGSR